MYTHTDYHFKTSTITTKMNIVEDYSNNNRNVVEKDRRFKTNVTENDIVNYWAEEKFKKTIELWDLSDEEINNLKELKEAIKDILHWKNQPNEVVRFMRARPKDLKAQVEMFKNMIEWRKENT